jgi:hypothetical protein
VGYASYTREEKKNTRVLQPKAEKEETACQYPLARPAAEELADPCAQPGGRRMIEQVATSMPAIMASLFLKRAVRKRNRSWVLSPISAKATVKVEVRNASIRKLRRGTEPKANNNPRQMTVVICLRSCQ